MKLPPSPKASPVSGHFKPFRKDPIRFLLNTAADQGDISLFKIFSKKIYFINHPDLIRQVMQKNHKNYHKSPSYKQIEELTGQGILTTDGEKWLMQRKLYQPAFSYESIMSYSGIVTRQTDRMLDEWKAGEEINISREMMKITLGVISESLFSRQIEYNTVLYDAIEYTLKWINDRAMHYPLVAPASWPTKKNKTFRHYVAELDKVIYEIIEHREAESEKPDDLLSRFMYAGDDLPKLSPKELRDELMTIFLAGHETSANVLMWTLHCLSLYPEVEQKLYEEVHSLGTTELDHTHLRELNYTNMVLNEVMRLFPPVWHLGRMNLEDDTLEDYPLPKGSHVRISPLAIHRHPDFWEEPEKFDPERFSEERSKDRHKFCFIPFGAGPRLCAGRNFAMMEMVLILAKLSLRYKISGNYQPVEMAPYLTLRPVNDIEVKFEER